VGTRAEAHGPFPRGFGGHQPHRLLLLLGQRAGVEAATVAERTDALAEEATARTTLGGALVGLCQAEAGLAELEAVRRLATKTGDMNVVLRAIANHSAMLVMAGRQTEAATVALEAEADYYAQTRDDQRVGHT
jgi:hypothetical protein